jgi:hypothetical protein
MTRNSVGEVIATLLLVAGGDISHATAIFETLAIAHVRRGDAAGLLIDLAS